MSAWQTALTEYLARRRALGCKLQDVGWWLDQFVRFADTEGAGGITTELALRWALRSAPASSAHRARRRGIVCQCAQYCSALAPCPPIPPSDLLPYRYPRKPPYLYSDAEITQLRHAAQQLPSPTGLRAAPSPTVFGLLTATGMRITEPIALDRTDADLSGGSLSMRGSKCGRSRWLPLHPTTRHALPRYAAQRDRLYPTPLTPSFFLSERGSRLTPWSVRATFVQLSQQIEPPAEEETLA